MKNINETMSKYTAGEITLEQANEELKKAEAGIRLDPKKNVLTEEEKRATTIGCYPDQANGFGLLDTGTGTLDPVQVRDNELVDNDMGDMPAFVCLAGTWYEVKGNKVIR